MLEQKVKKVFVAMSGGVDSSVAAALLKRATPNNFQKLFGRPTPEGFRGYDVHGVFMQGWSNPRFRCQWKSERQDAARVAAVLDIPFRTLDVSPVYYERVVSYLLDEYRNGRTPNPDVMCNKHIKFGLFFDWAMEQGADFVATGHYARLRRETQISNFKFQNYQLLSSIDVNKDQTYFLWTLSREHLRHVLFPIGGYLKSEVRSLARSFGLPVADKKDSQGVCFVGEGSMSEFLQDNIAGRRGDIKTKTGKKVGEHKGLEFYTIGQRHGIGSSGGGTPYYVAQKDAGSGTLLVAESDRDPILYRKEIYFKDAHWISSIVFPLACEARIRYRQPLAACRVFENRVTFDTPQRAVAPGQSIVFYKNGQVLGGGIIAS